MCFFSFSRRVQWFLSHCLDGEEKGTQLNQSRYWHQTQCMRIHSLFFVWYNVSSAQTLADYIQQHRKKNTETLMSMLTQVSRVWVQKFFFELPLEIGWDMDVPVSGRFSNRLYE